MPGRRGTPSERFWPKVDKQGPMLSLQLGPCWLWTGFVASNGYARFRVRNTGPQAMAHRAAYELVRGPIPDGLQLDHLCRNRACVNPAHLEPVTPRENVLRGTGRTAVCARRECCARGHIYTPENTRLDRKGARVCRACVREWARVATHRKRGQNV